MESLKSSTVRSPSRTAADRRRRRRRADAVLERHRKRGHVARPVRDEATYGFAATPAVARTARSVCGCVGVSDGLQRQRARARRRGARRTVRDAGEGGAERGLSRDGAVPRAQAAAQARRRRHGISLRARFGLADERSLDHGGRGIVAVRQCSPASRGGARSSPAPRRWNRPSPPPSPAPPRSASCRRPRRA